MKCAAAVFASVLVFATTALANVPSPELLSKLAAHQGRLDALEQKSEVVMSTKIEELKGNGEVISTWESVIKQRKVNGAESRELLKAVKDGKDVTEERKAQLAKDEGSAEKNQVQLAKSPFASSEQGRYTFDAEGPVEGQPDLERIAFEPREKTADVGIGKAVVNGKTGEVVRLEFSPAKLPTFVSRSDVTVQFDAETSAGRAPSAMSFYGEGGFLFLKKRARGTVKLEYPPEAAPTPPVPPAEVAPTAAAPAKSAPAKKKAKGAAAAPAPKPNPKG